MTLRVLREGADVNEKIRAGSHVGIDWTNQHWKLAVALFLQ
jgi:hypothetical protein